MSATKLIEKLEQILPGIQNSNSAAEAAMVEVLPDVIARLRLMADALNEISQRHIPDQPMAYDVSEAEYVRSHHTQLRRVAIMALEDLDND